MTTCRRAWTMPLCLFLVSCRAGDGEDPPSDDTTDVADDDITVPDDDTASDDTTADDDTTSGDGLALDVSRVDLETPAGATGVRRCGLAVDPSDPTSVVVTADADGLAPDGVSSAILVWHSADGGRTFGAPSTLLGGSGDSAGPAGMASPATRPDGATLVAGVFAGPPGEDGRVELRVSTRLSYDGGATFDPESVLDVMDVDTSVGPPPRRLATPALAVGAGGGAGAPHVQAAWVEADDSEGASRTLRLAGSADGGATWADPTDFYADVRDPPLGLEPLPAVLSHGTGAATVLWLGVQDEAPFLLVRTSLDGGGSWLDTNIAAPINPGAGLLGLTFGAAAGASELEAAACYSQSRDLATYNPQVYCLDAVSLGVWTEATPLFSEAPWAPLPHFVPAVLVTPEEGLRWTALVSGTHETTSVLLTRREEGATAPAAWGTLAELEYGADTLCAGTTATCQDGQRFIGDRMGIGTSAEGFVVAWALPADGAGPSLHVTVALARVTGPS